MYDDQHLVDHVVVFDQLDVMCSQERSEMAYRVAALLDEQKNNHSLIYTVTIVSL